MVAGEGFEPSKAEPGDLQSPPIGRSGNPPRFSIKQHAQITLDSSVLEIGHNKPVLGRYALSMHLSPIP